jgi:hypothetical protein
MLIAAPPRDRGHRPEPARLLGLAAAALAFVASAALAVAPTYTETTSEGHTDHRSLPEVEGAWTIALLAVPVLVAVAPLLVSPQRATIARTVAAAVLLVGALAGAATIGLFYFPAVALAVLAAALGLIDQD